MTHLTRDLQSSMTLKDRCALVVDAAWHRIVTVTTNPDLLAVVLFCVIGLGLTINALVRHPDLGLMVEQFNAFP